MNASSRVLFAAALSMALPAASSAAVVATGSYTVSKGVCKVFNGTDGTAVYPMNPGDVLYVTQSGTDLYMSFQTVPMYGKLTPDPKSPTSKAVAPFTTCTVNNTLDYSGANYNYMGRLDFKSSGSTIKLKAHYYTEGANNVFSPFVSFCSFNAEQTSPLDPGVSPCP